MKTLSLALLLALAQLTTSRAEDARFFRVAGPVATTITSFSLDGYLTWTNELTNVTFVVQTARSLSGESNWVDYIRVPVTNAITTHRIYDPNPPENMAWIPAGSFTMGSLSSEAQRNTDETWHAVTLTHGFYMGKYEVTQGQYLAVAGSNPSSFPGDLNRPVEMVSWDDATNYCRLLTQTDRAAGRIPTNWVYRLPTESEWEYACRAGTTTTFYFGSSIHGGMANFFSYYEYDAVNGDIYVASPVGNLERTTAVGSYGANAFGLYDMAGNVWEWCQDWLGAYPSGAVVNPSGSGSG